LEYKDPQNAQEFTEGEISSVADVPSSAKPALISVKRTPSFYCKLSGAPFRSGLAFIIYFVTKYAVSFSLAGIFSPAQHSYKRVEPTLR
jgi:hypothetical protein